MQNKFNTIRICSLLSLFIDHSRGRMIPLKGYFTSRGCHICFRIYSTYNIKCTVGAY